VQWAACQTIFGLVEILQGPLAIPEVPLWFPSVFGMWVTFPFYKVRLTLLFQDLLNFKDVFFLDLKVECFL